MIYVKFVLCCTWKQRKFCYVSHFGRHIVHQFDMIILHRLLYKSQDTFFPENIAETHESNFYAIMICIILKSICIWIAVKMCETCSHDTVRVTFFFPFSYHIPAPSMMFREPRIIKCNISGIFLYSCNVTFSF